jgi:O-6-methylguanine DNA methyltransferase
VSPAPRELLHVTRTDTALGSWSVVASPLGVCLVVLDPDPEARVLSRWSERWAPCGELVQGGGGVEAAAQQLAEYALGRRRVFELSLDLRGSDFQVAVWRALGSIPFGTTTTYGVLATRLGRPGGSRAVGQAAGANPVPVLVPCHRLLASSGLGGFSAGLQIKRRLLAHEGLRTPEQGRLPLGRQAV